MVSLYSPVDELELSLIRGILDGEGIRYFVLNDHFGSMRVGPRIDLLNKKTIMVAAEDLDRAKAIIADFLKPEASEAEEQTQYSVGQKLRMVMEAIVFGWFIPGRKRPKKS